MRPGTSTHSGFRMHRQNRQGRKKEDKKSSPIDSLAKTNHVDHYLRNMLEAHIGKRDEKVFQPQTSVGSCHKCSSQDSLFLEFTVMAGEGGERTGEKGKMESVGTTPDSLAGPGKWPEIPQHSSCGGEWDVFKVRS